MVLADGNFKGIVGENVTREQVGEIAKLLTEPDKEDMHLRSGKDNPERQDFIKPDEPQPDKTHPAINGYNRYDYIPVDGIKMPKPKPQYKVRGLGGD